MGINAEQLKELQTATAHIPNTPNPAVLPCSGPKLHIGIFFDGTGNKGAFKTAQGRAIRS